MQFYPRAHCLACHLGDLELEDSSGRGAVYSFTVAHWAPVDEFRAAVPYLLALVDMREGFRIMANILNCEADEVHIGMPVTVVFEERAGGRLVPQVEPDRSSNAHV
jgi:uncharacterized OB-fold protein